MEFKKFIKKPSIDMYAGIKVTKDTKFEYRTDKVEQVLENLHFHSVTKAVGMNYEGIYDVHIQLKEGDVLLFEDEGRGYIKPVEDMMTVAEAIEELECIKDI